MRLFVSIIIIIILFILLLNEMMRTNSPSSLIYWTLQSFDSNNLLVWSDPTTLNYLTHCIWVKPWKLLVLLLILLLNLWYRTLLSSWQILSRVWRNYWISCTWWWSSSYRNQWNRCSTSADPSSCWWFKPQLRWYILKSSKIFCITSRHYPLGIISRANLRRWWHALTTKQSHATSVIWTDYVTTSLLSLPTA